MCGIVVDKQMHDEKTNRAAKQRRMLGDLKDAGANLFTAQGKKRSHSQYHGSCHIKLLLLGNKIVTRIRTLLTNWRNADD